MLFEPGSRIITPVKSNIYIYIYIERERERQTDRQMNAKIYK